MIVWGLFVGTIDNFIKPWLIGFGVEMPMSLTILSVFGGFLAFGFLGLFIGPTLIAIMFTLLQAWEQTRRLEARIDDGRTIWKLSDMDLKSYSRWYDYSRARDEMFQATDTSWAP